MDFKEPGMTPEEKAVYEAVSWDFRKSIEQAAQRATTYRNRPKIDARHIDYIARSAFNLFWSAQEKRKDREQIEQLRREKRVEE